MADPSGAGAAAAAVPGGAPGGQVHYVMKITVERVGLLHTNTDSTLGRIQAAGVKAALEAAREPQVKVVQDLLDAGRTPQEVASGRRVLVCGHPDADGGPGDMIVYAGLPALAIMAQKSPVEV